MVQWLRFFASTTGGAGLIPGQEISACHEVQPKKKKKGKKMNRLSLHRTASIRLYLDLMFIGYLLLFSCSVASESFATPWTVAHQALYNLFKAKLRDISTLAFLSIPYPLWVVMSFGPGSFLVALESNFYRFLLGSNTSFRFHFSLYHSSWSASHSLV